MVQTNVKVNPDLVEERAKVSFAPEEFTNVYYGGAEKVAEKRFLGKAFSNENFLNVSSGL